jgi:outer membrane protein assembly factor BamB
VLLDNGRVYMKVLPASPNMQPSLLCLDALTGKLIMKPAQDHTATVSGFQFYIPQVSPEDVMHFRDRLSRSLTLLDKTIFTVEGGRFGMGVGILTPYKGQEAHNTLAAYKIDGQEFKLKWRAPVPGGARHRHADDQPDIQINKINYLSLPVPAGPGSPGLIVVTRRQNGLYAQSLSRTTGRALWETFLCEEPAQSLRWSPVGVAVEGGEAYIATGVGFVFALDATDGQIHWSAKYKQAKQTSGGQISTPSQRNGWDQDTILVRGGYVIVAPSDSPDLLRFDRRTGHHDRNERDESDWKYVMGVLGDNLYIGGQSQIWRFSIRTFGRRSMASSLQGIDQSLGRGVVTDSALYIPTKDGIVLLDPYSDRILKKIGLIRIDSSQSSDPIGNLFSDGRNLIVSGMDRTYALVGAAARLKQLDWRVERGDVRAMVERGRLRREAGKFDGALSDLRKAFQMSLDSIQKRRVRSQLLDVLLVQAKLSPAKAGPWLQEAERLAKSHEQRLRIQLALADHSSRQGQIDRAMRLYLNVATDPVGGTLAVEDQRAQTTVVGSQAASSALHTLLAEHPSLAFKLDEEAEKAWTQALKDAGPPGVREKAQLEIDVRHALAELSKARQLDKPDEEKILKLEESVRVNNLRIELLRRRQKDPLATVLMLERAFPETLAVVKAAQVMAQQAAIHFKARQVSQYETAEWMLIKLSQASQKRTAASALAALARFHQSVGQIQQAAMEWQRLKREYTGVTLGTATPILAQDAAQKGLALIPQDLRSNAQSSLRQMPKLPLEFLWKSETSKMGRVGLGSSNHTQFIEEHLLVINKATNRLHCKDVRTGRDNWVVQLFRADSRTSQGGKHYTHYYGYAFPNGQLLRAGHIGVLWNPGKTTRIEVIGLVTGRSLWRFGRTNEIPSKGTVDPMGFAHLAVGNGLIAVVLDDPTQGPRIRAYDLFTGKHRWTRSFERDAVGGIHIAHGFVNVLLNGGRQIAVCDRRTGSQLGKIQLTAQSAKRPALWPSAGLIHEREQTLVMSKLPSGNDQWKLALPPSKSETPTPAKLHSLNDRYIYVVARRSEKSHHWIVDTQTGKRVIDLSPANNSSVQIQVALSQDGKKVLAYGPSNSGGMQLTQYALDTGKASKSVSFAKSAIGLTLENLWADSAVVPIADKASGVSEISFFDLDSAKIRKDFVLSTANRRGNDSSLFGPQSDGKFHGLSYVEVRGDVLLITSKTHGMAAFGHRKSPRRNR